MGGIIFSLSGIPGSFLCTRLIDRKVCHPLLLLVGAYVLSAAAVVCIGFAGTSFWLLMSAIFVCGFFVIGAQFSMNAVITNYYPTAIRGTGIGWSQVVGRSGSLVGILVGGVLVTWGMTPWQLFQVSGVAPLLGALLLLVFMKVSGRSPAGAVDEREVAMREATG
jgi:AAHS family 4-hydroxybenzoate transporter-like MFS transporter